jgi:ferric-dicitrate binding protein FerR (iron transport regulator)
MTNRNHDNLNDRQRQAKEAVRQLSAPQADPDFRARLKSQFVAGDIPAGEFSSAAVPAALSAKSPRPRATWLGWSGLAAAAVLAAVFLGFNRLPGPEYLGSNGVGQVTVNGQLMDIDDTAALGASLKPGSRVQVGEGGSLDILYPGSFALRLGEGSDLVLPGRPGRWTGRRTEAEMAYGEVSVRTGPDLQGGQLVIRTAESRAVIEGTLVSVYRNKELTCVCLFEGSASVTTETADLGPVPPGKRWVLFSDGSEPQLLDIVPAHRDHMLGLDRTLPGVFDD